MNSIATILQNRKVETSTLSSRQAIIKMFIDELNNERDGKKYKPLSASFVASQMYRAGLQTDRDFWTFYGYCKEAQNFSACWWYTIKLKIQSKRNGKCDTVR